MAIEASDWTWLDPQRRIDQLELAQMCSLTVVELDELVDYGALGKELARRSELTPAQKNHLQYMEGALPDAFGCHLGEST